MSLSQVVKLRMIKVVALFGLNLTLCRRVHQRSVSTRDGLTDRYPQAPRPLLGRATIAARPCLNYRLGRPGGRERACEIWINSTVSCYGDKTNLPQLP